MRIVILHVTTTAQCSLASTRWFYGLREDFDEYKPRPELQATSTAAQDYQNQPMSLHPSWSWSRWEARAKRGLICWQIGSPCVGLELMLRRRPLAENKLEDNWNTWNNLMAKFWQDCEKLRVSEEEGFIREAKGISFIRAWSDELD